MSDMDAKMGQVQEIEARVSGKGEAVCAHDQDAHRLQHELSIGDICKRHKLVVWWCFYWAMAAVGW
jgi:hypothetical protein